MFFILTTNFTNPTNNGCVRHSLDLFYSWFIKKYWCPVNFTQNCATYGVLYLCRDFHIKGLLPRIGWSSKRANVHNRWWPKGTCGFTDGRTSVLEEGEHSHKAFVLRLLFLVGQWVYDKFRPLRGRPLWMYMFPQVPLAMLASPAVMHIGPLRGPTICNFTGHQ